MNIIEELDKQKAMEISKIQQEIKILKETNWKEKIDEVVDMIDKNYPEIKAIYFNIYLHEGLIANMLCSSKYYNTVFNSTELDNIKDTYKQLIDIPGKIMLLNQYYVGAIRNIGYCFYERDDYYEPNVVLRWFEKNKQNEIQQGQKMIDIIETYNWDQLIDNIIKITKEEYSKINSIYARLDKNRMEFRIFMDYGYEVINDISICFRERVEYFYKDIPSIWVIGGELEQWLNLDRHICVYKN